jgi:serine phosphatase RsbU (regulator of sigma subunit)
MAHHTQIPTLRMDPIAGPRIDRIDFTGENTFLLGRSSECDICLPDATISRRHVTVSNRNEQWILTDLGSRHGTFLNSIRIEPNSLTPIGHGDLLHIGPYMFRINSGHQSGPSFATTDEYVPMGTIVESVPPKEFDSLAHQRLALMIEGCAGIYQSDTESKLAQAVIDLIIAGTGFPRAALLRWNGSPDQVEVLAFHDHRNTINADFAFSRSLLKASANGSVARLTPKIEHQYGQSIVGLGISEALCAPLSIDTLVIGSIYVDTREGEAPAQPDAASFCHAVSQVASLALSNLKRIELTKRQDHLDADLKIAQEAQNFLLPDAEGIAGNLRYASRTDAGSIVGGDLFDIFEIDKNRTGICFGDITGHGIGAAILMTAVLSHLRTILATSGDPVAAVEETNTYLANHSSARMFSTLWVGVFDAEDNTLEFIDAGHGHWLVCKPDTPPYYPETPGGVIIGIQPNLNYTSASIPFHPGDRLILFSDGLVEQPNAELERFENTRLLEVISQSQTIENDVAMSFKALESFAGSRNFADDTTMASIQVHSQLSTEQ